MVVVVADGVDLEARDIRDADESDAVKARVGVRDTCAAPLMAGELRDGELGRAPEKDREGVCEDAVGNVGLAVAARDCPGPIEATDAECCSTRAPLDGVRGSAVEAGGGSASATTAARADTSSDDRNRLRSSAF